jgi:hypothetical protein
VKLSIDDGYKKWIHNFSEVRSFLAKQPNVRPKKRLENSIRLDIMEVDCVDI